MKIEIKLFNGQIMPELINIGEWCDLRCNEDVTLKAPKVEVIKNKNGNETHKVTFDSKLFGLGVAMRLPRGYEAVILPRSSTFKKTHTILSNSQGVIDNSYSGDNDEWKYNAIALSTSHIKKGDRICQFRIQLSQKATVWQKLRWLFSSKIKLVQVDHLGNEDRGGFGSTDTKETK